MPQGFLNLQRFARDVAEEGALARRLKLFRSERKRLDGERQFEMLGDVEDLLDAISSRAFEIGNDYEVDIAERVYVSSRYASEQKNALRTKLSADPLD